MFSAFQISGFQRSGYQIGAGSSGDTHDGAIDYGHYKRYRKRLERIAKAAEKHQQSKYVKQAVEIAAMVEDLPIASPLVQEIANSVKLDIVLPEIDFSALQSELNRLIRYLDTVIQMKIIEMDDEIAFLLLV